MSYDTKNIENGFTIGLIGSETDYQGMVYLDNVTLMSETKQEEDIYVDATEEITGQDMKLSVQGDTLVTGAGSSEIQKNITLADGQATDSVRQVYAYLQAVRQEAVIYPAQIQWMWSAPIPVLLGWMDCHLQEMNILQTAI